MSTTSLRLAKLWGMEHRHVLYDIKIQMRVLDVDKSDKGYIPLTYSNRDGETIDVYALDDVAIKTLSDVYRKRSGQPLKPVYPTFIP